MQITIRGFTYEAYRLDIAPECVWLYAHVFMPFLILKVGEEVRLGGVSYKVFEILDVEAVRPQDPYSDFILDEKVLSGAELRDRLVKPGGLILQTCPDGTSEGRRFACCKRASDTAREELVEGRVQA